MTAVKNDAPADTTMMGVVHDALRRDLRRLDLALADSEAPLPPARRAALGAHVEWMMDFLHHHHQGEDVGLWPLLRGRSADAGAVIDGMEAEHARIAPAMTAVTGAARRFGDGGTDGRRELLASLQDLSDVLLPHLRHEEDAAMPLVSATMSEGEWRAWDQKYNVKGKSLGQLAREGHWLMDNLDAPRYDVLVHLVPAPARVLIVKGFARRYRNACLLRWGPGVAVGPLAG
jgi:hemerythrin-like domain-containing protein